MTKMVKCLLLLCVLGISTSIYAQSQKIEKLFEDVEQLDDAGLYGECLQKLDEIIEETADDKDQTNFIKASIMKAETFRKTEHFRRGMTILEELENTKKYPELHVKKLVRMAAIYRQDIVAFSDVDNDSLLNILNEGIRLAKHYGIFTEEASLRNELGYKQSEMADRAGNAGDLVTEAQLFSKAERNLKMAADIFRSVGDTENELWVMRNILITKIWKGEIDAFNELYPQILEKLEGNEWYQLQAGIYRLIGNVKTAEGDTINGYSWSELAHASTSDFHAKKNTTQMAAFTNIHDTERFKKEAIEKQAALDL
ncbi:hypothetical protein OAK35_00050 [Crocinitomicaceae bacterium]|nr:hypothetical protein [Crocinitomicaceae bacterium]